MIEEHPTSVSVSEGEYANFTCSINCSAVASMRWRLAVPRLGVMRLNENYLKVKLLQKRWDRKGVVIQNESMFCESTGCEVVTIKILATRELDGAVVQCGAFGRSQDVETSYSAFALLYVVPQPEPDQPEPDQPGREQPNPQPQPPPEGDTGTEETTTAPPPASH